MRHKLICISLAFCFLGSSCSVFKASQTAEELPAKYILTVSAPVREDSNVLIDMLTRLGTRPELVARSVNNGSGNVDYVRVRILLMDETQRRLIETELKESVFRIQNFESEPAE